MSSSQPSSSKYELIDMQSDDLLIWPDQVWCLRHDLADVGAHKSDDYITIKADDPMHGILMSGARFGPYDVAILQAVISKKASTIEHVEGCFNAAIIEGLEQVLAESTDSRLKDLVERRLMYAAYRIKEDQS